MYARIVSLGCAVLMAAGCADSSKPNTASTGAGSGSAATNRGITTSTVPEGDVDNEGDVTNTARNKRDRDEGALTADDQSESGGDLETTAEIRRAITKDKSLSVNAHNVKIIAKDGTVTLRGPVDSEEEKSVIVAEAHRVAGDANVVDELEVEGSENESE